MLKQNSFLVVTLVIGADGTKFYVLADSESTTLGCADGVTRGSSDKQLFWKNLKVSTKALMMNCFFQGNCRIYTCNFTNKGLGYRSFYGNLERILRSVNL